MSTVFILQHVHEFDDGHEDVKLIGVFSSEVLARAAQQRVIDQPGFRDLPEGFEISEHRIDGNIGWPQGYVTVHPGVMLHLIEQHRSPDGLLTLKVGREDDGDVCIGFDGYSWHTHADILASLSGLSEDEAVRRFVDNLLCCRAIIAVARVGGKIRDVWIPDEAVADKYKPEDETIEFRYWDGRPAT